MPAADKEAARSGLIEIGKAWNTPDTQFWTPMRSTRRGSRRSRRHRHRDRGPARRDHDPQGRGPGDIHYVDRLLAQLEAKVGLGQPLLVHAILETARGVANVEEICAASPRMQGLSLGPADLAANRRMKTTRRWRAPWGLVRQDPSADEPMPRTTYQQDLWHYTIARMVDACVTAGVLPYSARSAISPTPSREDQFRNAYLLGCVGAWSLHPSQIDIARRAFSPDRPRSPTPSA